MEGLLSATNDLSSFCFLAGGGFLDLTGLGSICSGPGADSFSGLMAANTKFLALFLAPVPVLQNQTVHYNLKKTHFLM